MAGETLYAGQAGPTASDSIGSGQSLGQKWVCSEPGRFIVGGASWVQAGVFFPLWQIWLKGSPSTIEIELDITSLDPAGNTDPEGGTGWFRFLFSELSEPPWPVPEDTVHIVNQWTGAQAGNYRYADSGFSYPFPPDSVLTTSGSIYNNGQASSVPPIFEGFTNGRFYADLLLDSPAPPAPPVPPRRLFVPRNPVLLRGR